VNLANCEHTVFAIELLTGIGPVSIENANEAMQNQGLQA
jgi:hypothetical protein